MTVFLVYVDGDLREIFGSRYAAEKRADHIMTLLGGKWRRLEDEWRRNDRSGRAVWIDTRTVTP